MFASGVRATGALVAEITHHVHTIAILFQRAEGLRELKTLALGGRSPFVHRRPMRDIKAAKPRLRNGRCISQRRLCRHHGFQEGQRKRDTSATQKRSPGKVLFRDEHYWVSSAFLIRIWNGLLFTIPRTSDENR